MAGARLRLWCCSGIAVLLAAVAGQQGLAQSVATLNVPNGGFDSVTGGYPTDWTAQAGGGDVFTGTSACLPSGGSSSYFCMNTSTAARARSALVNVAWMTYSEKDSASLALSYSVAWRVCSGTTAVTLRYFNYSEASIGTKTLTLGCENSQVFHREDGFAPILTDDFMPLDTAYIAVEIQAYQDRAAWDSIGPLTITFDTDTSGGGSGGGGGGSVSLETLFDVDGSVIGTIQTAASGYVSQACGALSSIGSISGLVPDAWGGAGFGGQIAQILLGRHQICEQKAATVVLEDILDGIITPETLPGITGPVTPSAGTPAGATLPEYSDAIASHEGQSDDLVTAQNRANQIAIANAKYQLAELQKLRDAHEVTYSYQTPRGPRIAATDIAAQEPNMEFGEGDYAQTFERINELVDEAEIEPNMFRRSQASGTVVEEDAGACLLETPAPDGDGWAYQAERARWNIRQQLVGSDVGQLMCSIVDPEITPGDLCLQSTIAPLAGISLIGGMMPAQICVEGPNAVDPVPLLFSMLSVLILLGGCMAAIGEFV